MKQQLAELIEAYAAARTSGNQMLLEYAVNNLNAMLQKIDVVESKPKDAEPQK